MGYDRRITIIAELSAARRTQILLVYFRLFMGILTVSPLIFAAEGDWPRFRGSNGDGVVTHAKIPNSWPESGPKLVWERAIGHGYSETIVADSRIYTMEQTGEAPDVKTWVLAFNVSDGSPIWRKEIGEGYQSDWGNGPRSTPFLDQDRLYVLGPKGDFAALSAKDGSLIWKVQLVEELGSSVPGFGFASSPVVEGDLVLLEVGGDDGLFWAFDKQTGKRQWSILKGEAGYMTPKLTDIGGVRQMISVSSDSLVGLDLEGNMLWSLPWPNQGETIATPIFFPPDRLFISSVKADLSAMARIEKDGSGFSAQEIWRNRNLKNHFSASVSKDGFIYGFDNATFKCISAEDGAVQWARRGYGKGGLILADGKLIILSDRGLLVMIEASPVSFKELGRHQALKGRSWTSPVLAGSHLYLRNHEKMVCYNLTHEDQP